MSTSSAAAAGRKGGREERKERKVENVVGTLNYRLVFSPFISLFKSLDTEQLPLPVHSHE
jgi:hypothetical protein